MIYLEKTNTIRIRGDWNWYKHWEKSSNFFLNFEKSCSLQNQIQNILIGNKEANNQKDINNELYLYYKISLMGDNTYQNMTWTIILTQFLNFLNYLMNNLWNVKNLLQKNNYLKLEMMALLKNILVWSEENRF